MSHEDQETADSQWQGWRRVSHPEMLIMVVACHVVMGCHGMSWHGSVGGRPCSGEAGHGISRASAHTNRGPRAAAAHLTGAIGRYDVQLLEGLGSGGGSDCDMAAGLGQKEERKKNIQYADENGDENGD